NRQQRHDQREDGASDEYDRALIYAVCEARKPALHGEVDHWPCDEIREEDEPAEFAGEEPHDVEHGAPHHLAHADLLRALLGRERGEADEAEARDEDRKPREVQEHLSLPLLALI